MHHREEPPPREVDEQLSELIIELITALINEEKPPRFLSTSGKKRKENKRSRILVVSLLQFREKSLATPEDSCLGFSRLQLRSPRRNREEFLFSAFQTDELHESRCSNDYSHRSSSSKRQLLSWRSCDGKGTKLSGRKREDPDFLPGTRCSVLPAAAI